MSKYLKVLLLFTTFAVVPFYLLAKTNEIKLITNAHCEGCKAKIEKALKKIEGVEEASLDLPTKIAFIKYDSDKVDAKDFVAALEKIGYTAQIYKEGSETDSPTMEKSKCCNESKSSSCCKDKKTNTNSNKK